MNPKALCGKSYRSVFLVSLYMMFLFSIGLLAQQGGGNTYCNPLNLDYTYMIYNAHDGISYRSGADPAVVEFRGEYYMFVTRSMGYWHSTDLTRWTFVEPVNWYFEGSNAPAAFNYKDSVLFVTGHPSGTMSILYTDDPFTGDWKAVPGILYDLQDPALFIDDDDQAYMFWGSSNLYPIRGRKLDMNNRFKPSEEIHELFNLDEASHGWERFGENHLDTLKEGYIEGCWMTKHEEKYYLQYGAPGTEFNVYGEGTYMADHPLGPYSYAPNNPWCYKPGGFANGAGHGSTVSGPGNIYWHFGTMALAYNVGWERRINLFPTFFDDEGLMYSNTAFGDYPHYAPSVPEKAGAFTGWMLLSYGKPVSASGFADSYRPAHVTDEQIKTFWLSESSDDRQWIRIDLEKPGEVYAIQVNFHDYNSGLYGRLPDLYHRYVIEGSLDGENWHLLVDRSDNLEDVPNDYVELDQPCEARYIRYSNIHVPTLHLAISGLRVFGKGSGKAPRSVRNIVVERHADRRNASISWDALPGCQGYNVKWGIAPGKTYNSWMVYDENFLELRSLSAGQSYYFSVEGFNENGISPASVVIRTE